MFSKVTVIYKFFLLLSFSLLILFSSEVLAQRRKEKEIYFSDPKYLKRNSQPWAKQSRIVGCLKNPPEEFTVEIYSKGFDKPVKTLKFNNKFSIFDSDWLPAPGVYTVFVTAEGYGKGKLNQLKLEPMTDCVVDIEFGKIAYERNY